MLLYRLHLFAVKPYLVPVSLGWQSLSQELARGENDTATLVTF